MALRCTLPLICVALGCSDPTPDIFEHDHPSGATPWTRDAFDDEEGKFTFAVFSDLNGSERPRIFEVAVRQLSLLRPELILSVGDLIDGYSEDLAKLTSDWDAFDARAEQASAPVFRVGGNHDLTNQVMRDVWAQRYSSRYYHFVYKSVLFLVLDTEDYTNERMREIYLAREATLEARAQGVEGVEDMEYYRIPERQTGEIGAEQSDYFRAALADHPGVRWTMLFMHKPVWLDGQDPDFVAIETALSDRPYTLFNGHRHTMSHAVRNGRDYIMLGTTGGGQSRSTMAFDHITLVTVAEGGPSIAHLRLDGILPAFSLRIGRVGTRATRPAIQCLGLPDAVCLGRRQGGLLRPRCVAPGVTDWPSGC